MKYKAIARWLGKRINQALGLPDVDALRGEINSGRDRIQRTREQHAALSNVIGKIRASLDLDSLFATTTQETCQLLKVERVAVYRFNPDYSGEFVSSFGFAQCNWDQIAPFGKKLVWEDTYLQETKGGRYRANETFAVADIYKAGHSRCHVDILEQFKIRAYAIAPIFNGLKLWGFLAAYQHSAPRHWEPTEVEFLAQVASHLGVAMQHSELFMQLQTQSLALKKSLTRQQALTEVVTKIRSELDMPSIFHTTCRELRQLLNVERVAVYQFKPDWSGEFISHFGAADDRWEQIAPFGKKLVWEDSYLQETQGGRYRRNESFAVADVEQAGHSQCHLDILRQFKIRAYALVPIFVGRKLWGLLGAYQHSAPRQWEAIEVQFMAQAATQLGVAVQQTALLNESKQRTQALNNSIERQRALTEVVSRIRSSLDVNLILQTTCQEARHLLEVERVAVYQFNKDWSGEFVAQFGKVVPEWKHIAPFGKDLVWEDTHLQETQGGRYRRNETFAVADVSQSGHSRCHMAILEEYQIRAYAIAPIFVGRRLWGLLAAYQHSAPRDWATFDVEFLAQIGAQLGVAIRSAELLSATQRAEELQKAAEQRQILFEVVAKIRESLDLDTIFKNLSTGVRRSLKADRVGIYRFEPESEFNAGEFIVEDVVAGFPSALNAKIQDHCFSESYVDEYAKGRIHTLTDLDEAEVQACYRATLEQFGIRALLVAPIVKGGQLWGLLCVHQCTQPRQWEEIEVQFVKQVADQLGIALQQSELLAQTKAQTEQLTIALQDLQNTQIQIVQAEKLASLGQLVAGVAHEINNPINFIHGNLTYAEEYFNELLKLIKLYQQHCPLVPEIEDALQKADLEFLVGDLKKVVNSMQVGTDRIREIVLSLRNFSRLDEAECKLVNIHEGIDSTLMILTHRLKPSRDNPGIQIEKDYDPLPLVECYPGQLNQVFMNLIANAIDALEERNQQRSTAENEANPGIIRIWTELSNSERVAIHIADNGTGIPASVQQHLFEPFFTTKDVGKGTGLGLSISYQIITEKHNGKLACYSDFGRGTEFVIELPIHQTVVRS